ncbi:MAG TPA: hypothetical protein VF172_12195 [Nitrososphaera sp.]
MMLARLSERHDDCHLDRQPSWTPHTHKISGQSDRVIDNHVRLYMATSIQSGSRQMRHHASDLQDPISLLWI